MVYGLSYSAQDRYDGREVMFFADRLQLPAPWLKSNRILMSPERSGHPVYGKMENMKPHPEMTEGPAAFERFQKAMKTIVSVRKSDVMAPLSKTRRRKKKPVSRKG
jgi:hypothetical protein